MKPVYLPLAIAVTILSLLMWSDAQAQGISQLQQWKLGGTNYLQPINTAYGLRIPGLATSTTGCLAVSSSGWISASGTACGSGAGGSFPFTATANYNSTSTPIGFLNGLFSTASSTFNSTLNLPFATDKALATDVSGKVYGAATTTASCSTGASCPSFGIFGSSPVSITVSGLTTANFSSANISQWTNNSNYITLGSLSATFPIAYNSGTGALTFGGLSTSSAAVIGGIPYFSGVNTFANVATGTISASSPLSVTAGRYAVGGAAAFSITQSGATTDGYLSAADFLVHNNKVGTSTAKETAGQLAYFTTTSGTPALITGVATGTISGTNGVTATAGRSAIGGALTIDCTAATRSATGCLSAADFGTFANKTGTSTAKETAGQLGYYTTTSGTPALMAPVSTTSVSGGTGISLSALPGGLVGGSALTITNSGVISLGNGTGVTCTGTNPGSCSLAAINANTLLANGTGASAIPTAIATSTLYGTCSGGQVVGWSNTLSGLACIATSTGSGGDTPGGTATELQYRAGASSLGAVANSAWSTSGFLGIGSSTPWAVLSVASSTWGNIESDNLRPLFAVATSSDVYGQILSVFATSTGTPNGARVGIGATTQLGFNGLLDSLFVRGPINSSYVSILCNFTGLITSVNADQNNICQAANFDETGNGVANIAVNSDVGQLASLRPGVTGATNVANDGAMIKFGDGGNGVGASRTTMPSMEWKFQTANMTMSTSTWIQLGLFNGNTTVSALQMVNGCGFVASSTESNWKAVCVGATAASITVLDTGISSSTAGFLLFKMVDTSTAVAFYVKTGTTALTKVGSITTNLTASTAKTGICGSIGREQAAGPTQPQLNISRCTLWYRDALVNAETFNP